MENNRSFYERGRVGAISSTADKSLSVGNGWGGEKRFSINWGQNLSGGRYLTTDSFLVYFFKRRNRENRKCGEEKGRLERESGRGVDFDEEDSGNIWN